MKVIEGKYNTLSKHVMMMIDNNANNIKNDIVICLMDEKENTLRITIDKQTLIKYINSL